MSPRFRFRLVHLFYVIALLGASLATCGAVGVVIFLIVIAGWYHVFWRENAKPIDPAALVSGMVNVLVIAAIIGMMSFLVFPAISTPSSAYRGMGCVNNLKHRPENY